MTPELVEVSLYGATSTVFEQITGVPGSYGRCFAGIDRLLARGIPVGLKTVVMRENVHEARAMRRMAEGRCLPFRLDAAIFPCRDGCRTPLEHRVPVEEAVALEMEDEALLRRTVDYFQRMRGTAPDDHLFVCGAGLTAFHVDAAGMLWPCLMASTHGFDLRRGSFREGWENVLPRFREQKVEVGYRCHQCEKRFLCGLCPAQTAMETGDPQRRAEYLCALGEARWRRIQPFLDK
jgi:radical SAM protein with 4Fe4S-binding SPASM domain